MEVLIIVSSTVGLYFGRYITNFMEYKYKKRRLKKRLHLAIRDENEVNVRHLLNKIKDFDSKYGTNKYGQYISSYIRKYNHINPEKLRLFSKGNAEFEEIYTSKDDINKIEEDEELAKDELQENINMANKILSEVERKRREIIIRKNKIRRQQILKGSKLDKPKGKI